MSEPTNATANNEPLAIWEVQLLHKQTLDDLERALGIIDLLASELRVWTGHWKHAPEGIPRHDKRMADDGCAVCALLDLAWRQVR